MNTATDLRCATACATDPGASGVAGMLAEQLTAGLDGGRADVTLLFASPHFLESLPQLAVELHEALPTQALLGVSGESVIAGEREFENEPALVAWAAKLPGATVRSFHLSNDDIAGLDSPESLQESLGVLPTQQPDFVLLADPYSFDIARFVETLNQHYPNRTAVGGMASAASAPGENVLIFEGQALHQGLVGLSLTGAAAIDTVVSQGCRPIGRHMVITKAERNIIYQIGGRSALATVQELIEECPARDKELMRRRGLLVGRVINEYQPSFSRGDFLIRNPLGFDASSGAMAVSDLVRVGQTIQFHVRDGATAHEDLESLLSAAGDESTAGVLLFSCNGRGTRLFPEQHHDARCVSDAFGSPALAGFFCAGEIGPIGEKNFLHGHTASVGLLRRRRPQTA
ncbi:FIST N domain protein [Phycisphaerae bacterium RAS1]|nr:FIST N domain protein [Phycisphaerae bacterium RAS1]